MNALELVMKRRSIRKFLDQPVSEDLLRDLLRAAMAAPSACNAQPWEFVVVTQADMLEQLRGILPFGKMTAPAAIVVCGNPLKAKNAAGKVFWVQDCSAATENLLVAATGMGLGSVWIGVHPIPGLGKRISNLLHLPAYVSPLCVVYVGFPGEEKEIHTKYDENRVHWQTYNGKTI